ncbi:unnamed protein product [Diamesa serratosioi]
MPKVKSTHKFSLKSIQNRRSILRKKARDLINNTIVESSIPENSNDNCLGATEEIQQQIPLLSFNNNLESNDEHDGSDINDNDDSHSSLLEQITQLVKVNKINSIEVQMVVIDFMKKFFIENNSTREFINIWLNFFKNIFPMLPIDARTLLGTPKEVGIIPISPGKYIHIGIKRNIDNYVSKLRVIPNEIKFDVNIDGFQVFKNAKENCMWEISGLVKEPEEGDVFLIVNDEPPAEDLPEVEVFEAEAVAEACDEMLVKDSSSALVFEAEAMASVNEEPPAEGLVEVEALETNEIGLNQILLLSSALKKVWKSHWAPIGKSGPSELYA